MVAKVLWNKELVHKVLVVFGNDSPAYAKAILQHPGLAEEMEKAISSPMVEDEIIQRMAENLTIRPRVPRFDAGRAYALFLELIKNQKKRQLLGEVQALVPPKPVQDEPLHERGRFEYGLD